MARRKRTPGLPRPPRDESGNAAPISAHGNCPVRGIASHVACSNGCRHPVLLSGKGRLVLTKHPDGGAAERAADALVPGRSSCTRTFDLWTGRVKPSKDEPALTESLADWFSRCCQHNRQASWFPRMKLAARWRKALGTRDGAHDPLLAARLTTAKEAAQLLVKTAQERYRIRLISNIEYYDRPPAEDGSYDFRRARLTYPGQAPLPPYNQRYRHDADHGIVTLGRPISLYQVPAVEVVGCRYGEGRGRPFGYLCLDCVLADLAAHVLATNIARRGSDRLQALADAEQLRLVGARCGPYCSSFQALARPIGTHVIDPDVQLPTSQHSVTLVYESVNAGTDRFVCQQLEALGRTLEANRRAVFRE